MNRVCSECGAVQIGTVDNGRAELAHALSVALGSLAEVDALLQIARDLRYLSEETHQHLVALRDEASRVTFGLQRSIRR